MNIQFLGAAGTVTGSSFLVKSDRGRQVLVDMGMFQGSPAIEELNNRPISFEASMIQDVFLTHAHLDHVGRMPILMKNGFSGKIYMTAATRDIAEVVLLDAAKIMQQDEEKPILYTKEDVFSLLNHSKIVRYGEEIRLDGVTAVFRDAGHILGSASIELSFDQPETKVAFSGDIGNSPEELVKPTEYIESANTVVMESTYGGSDHSKEVPAEVLAEEINMIEQGGGALLIPSFSVERTQVLLYLIDQLKNIGKIKADTPVYLDSPMGERVTQIYKSYPDLFSSKLQDELMRGDPFSFSGLSVVSGHRESQEIHDRAGAKVIIAGSGMMTGGRILEHALYYLPLRNTRLLIVGFQAEETVGRALEEGARRVRIYGENVDVAATVSSLHSLSSHADRTKLLKWLGEVKGASKVCLVHGENSERNALKTEVEKSCGAEVYTPSIDDILDI